VTYNTFLPNLAPYSGNRLYLLITDYFIFFVIQVLNTKLSYSIEENGYKTLSDATVPTNAMEGNLSDRLTVAQLCKKFSVTDPYGRILGFLHSSCYFSIK
jgi:hypothetical protein